MKHYEIVSKKMNLRKKYFNNNLKIKISKIKFNN